MKYMDPEESKKLAEGIFESNRPLFEKLAELEKKDNPLILKTRVVYCQGDTRSTEGYVYIGRPSKYGNIYVIGRDGDRPAVVAKHRHWAFNYDATKPEWAGVPPPPTKEEIRRELRGKVLACWCKRDDRNEPCHGDVLAEIADSED